jgi:hypothetical protein
VKFVKTQADLQQLWGNRGRNLLLNVNLINDFSAQLAARWQAARDARELYFYLDHGKINTHKIIIITPRAARCFYYTGPFCLCRGIAHFKKLENDLN